jgi:hypothetical protein
MYFFIGKVMGAAAGWGEAGALDWISESVWLLAWLWVLL